MPDKTKIKINGFTDHLGSFSQIISIAKKEMWQEQRSRLLVSTVLLFVIGSAFLIAIALGEVVMTPSIFAVMLWILIYFGNLSGLGRAFVSEKERGTDLFLKLNFSGHAVYFGKLLFNIMVSIAVSLASYALLMIFVPVPATASPYLVLWMALIGGVGLASGMTIISAIVAVAKAKSGLLPILSLPVVLPVLLLGIEATEKAIATSDIASFSKDFLFLLFFSGAIVAVSYAVFGFVWDD